MDDLLQRIGLQPSDLDISVETPSSSLSEDFSHLTSTPNQQINHRDPGIVLWMILDKLSSLAASKSLPPVDKVKQASEKPLTLGEIVGATS